MNGILGGRIALAVGFGAVQKKDQIPLGDKILLNLMTPYRESELRKLADPPTNSMIDLWCSLSEKVLGRPIEVVVDNRRNNPKLRPSQHEINTAFPAGYKGKVVLSVWLDAFPNLSFLMVTHEIGHWILYLQGFRGMLCHPRDFDREGLLNSLASHPPLYNLQRSIGHDPQDDVDSRCDHDIKLSSQPGAIDDVASALYLADDLLNCSFKKRSQLRWTLRRNQPGTLRLVERIVAIASDHDLLDHEQNVGFRRTIVKEMKLKGVWSESDNVKSIKDLILEVEGTASA